MISRYNQHSPHSAQLLPEQIPLDAKRSISYFSILTRGLTGIYQHVSEQHLQRYVTEFDFPL